MTKTIQCPDCDEAVIIPDDAMVGDMVECQNCATEMEVISVTPPQVSLIVEEK